MKITSKTVIVCEQELVLSIGVHEHEKRAPQRLIVSVEVEMDEDDEGDEIARTLDYDALYNFIKAQQDQPHSELQETVGRRILGFILALPGVRRATVETRKPDVFPDCSFVGVRFEGTP